MVLPNVNYLTPEILRIVDIFRCKIIDVGKHHYIIEVTGDEGKIKALLNLLKPMGIKKLAQQDPWHCSENRINNTSRMIQENARWRSQKPFKPVVEFCNVFVGPNTRSDLKNDDRRLTWQR